MEKYSTIKDFILKIEIIVGRIENNKASLSDYQNFQIIMEGLGLDKDMIKAIMDKYGFENWEHFVNERKKIDNDLDLMESTKVSSVINIIKAIATAATDTLLKFVKQAEKDELKAEAHHNE